MRKVVGGQACLRADAVIRPAMLRTDRCSSRAALRSAPRWLSLAHGKRLPTFASVRLPALDELKGQRLEAEAPGRKIERSDDQACRARPLAHRGATRAAISTRTYCGRANPEERLRG